MGLLSLLPLFRIWEWGLDAILVSISYASLVAFIGLFLKFRIWKPALIGGGLGVGLTIMAFIVLYILLLIVSIASSIAFTGQ